MFNMCFLSSLEFWYVLGRGCLLIKTLGTESLMSFPSRVLTQVAAQRIGSAWKTTGSLCLVSSVLRPMCLFPLLADCVLLL